MNAPATRQQNSNQVVAAKKEPVTVEGILEANKAAIVRALTGVEGLNPERAMRIALTELRKNSKLKQCDPYSFLGAVVQAAQLGLEVGGGLGHAYLVPYKQECTMIIGYKGLADLARRSGRIKGIWSYLVFPEDVFEEGVDATGPYLRYEPHRSGKARDPEKEIIGAFSLAKFDDGSVQWAFMEKWEIDRIRSGLRYTSDVWKDHYGEMAKKTTLRRLAKLIPQSPQLVMANEHDDETEAGTRRAHEPCIDMGLVDGTYEPQAQGHDPDKAATTSAAAANDHELPGEKKESDSKERKEHDEVIAKFLKLVAEFEDLGGSMKETLKMEKAEVIKLPIQRIRAASMLLGQVVSDAKKGIVK